MVTIVLHPFFKVDALLFFRLYYDFLVAFPGEFKNIITAFSNLHLNISNSNNVILNKGNFSCVLRAIKSINLNTYLKNPALSNHRLSSIVYPVVDDGANFEG